MKPRDDEILELQELALTAKAEEACQKRLEKQRELDSGVGTVGHLRGIGGGAERASPEMIEHRRHLDLHAEHAEKQAKLFARHCRELVELGATSVTMFGCQATFERKK